MLRRGKTVAFTDLFSDRRKQLLRRLWCVVLYRADAKGMRYSTAAERELRRLIDNGIERLDRDGKLDSPEHEQQALRHLTEIVDTVLDEADDEEETEVSITAFQAAVRVLDDHLYPFT